MIVRLVSVALCAHFLLATGSAQAQTPQGRVAGQVVSAAAGDGLPGVQVRLRSEAGPERMASTNTRGRFEFTAVVPGTYDLVAAALGMSPAARSVVVTTGTQPDLTLVLVDIVRERINVVGHPTALDRIPGSASMIDAAEMRKLRIATGDVHQMLRQVPGVNIQEEEGYGLRPNIGMRGTGTDRSSKITLMEDGVLIAPAPYSAPAAYYSPTAGRMEGLEVRKGSSQVKYGPMTTGGALNYLSTSVPASFRLRADVAGGGDATRRVFANVGDSRRHVGWLVEAFQFRTDGFKALDGGGDTGVDLEDYLAKFRFNTAPTATMYQELEVKLGHTEQTGDETYLGVTDADFATAPLRRYAASQVDVFSSTHEQYQVRHLLARPTWDLTTIAYRHDFTRAWYKLDSVDGTGLGSVLANPGAFPAEMAVLTGGDSGPNALTVRNNNRTYYGAGVQSVLGVSFGAAAAHELEVGLRYHQDEEDRFQQDDGYQMTGRRMVLTRAGAPGSQTNRVAGATAVAGFVADTMTWGRWTVSPGLRFETIDLRRTDYERTDPTRTGASAVRETSVNVFVPGVGARYVVRPGLSVFGGVHRGFAPPGPGSAAETKAEESVNYEFGARVERAAGSVEVVGFFNDYGNLLGRDTLSTGGTGEGDLFNGGEVRVHGLEASALWNVPLASRGVSLPVRIAYTYTGAEFRNTFESQYGPWGDVEVGDTLPYLPRHQVHASADLERPQWRARVNATYVGRMRTMAGQGAFVESQSTDAYLVIGLSGEYTLTAGARLFASVQNVADTTYIVARHPAGARPGLPRLVTAGLRIDLGR